MRPYTHVEPRTEVSNAALASGDLNAWKQVLGLSPGGEGDSEGGPAPAAEPLAPLDEPKKPSDFVNDPPADPVDQVELEDDDDDDENEDEDDDATGFDE